MKFLVLTLMMSLTLVWIWPLSPGRAETPLILKNGTGQPIHAVYLASAGTNDWSGWGGDGPSLDPGRKWRVAMESPASAEGLKDLRVIFVDGMERTYYGLDLALYTYVVLGETEAQLYEWDPAGQTHIR